MEKVLKNDTFDNFFSTELCYLESILLGYTSERDLHEHPAYKEDIPESVKEDYFRCVEYHFRYFGAEILLNCVEILSKSVNNFMCEKSLQFSEIQNLLSTSPDFINKLIGASNNDTKLIKMVEDVKSCLEFNKLKLEVESKWSHCEALKRRAESYLSKSNNVESLQRLLKSSDDFLYEAVNHLKRSWNYDSDYSLVKKHSIISAISKQTNLHVEIYVKNIK